jgi:Phage integrase family
MPHLHFHDLRHTFASQWVMSGGDLYLLKEILGHKSIAMTQRYAHLSPAHKQAMVSKMETMWAKAAKTVGAQNPSEQASEIFSGHNSVTKNVPPELDVRERVDGRGFEARA